MSNERTVKIKALTVKGDWGMKILNGEKTIETRTWSTDYRGPLVFTASKTPKTPLSGTAFAIVQLVACIEMTQEHEKAACCEVYDKARSWIFTNMAPIIPPLPVNGQQGLFNIEIPEHYLDTVIPDYLKCVKCGNIAVPPKARYGFFLQDYPYPASKDGIEKIRYRCMVCGYYWIKDTLDNMEETDGQ